MKVNITLLTMITLTARANAPLPPEVGPAPVDMERIPGRFRPKRRARARGAKTSVPFQDARERAASQPARLADGLGLESAPIPCAGICAPETGRSRSIGSPAPMPGGTEFGYTQAEIIRREIALAKITAARQRRVARP